MRTFDSVQSHRDSHKNGKKPEGEQEKARIDALLDALNAADAECKRLEYWSDIRDVIRHGEAFGEDAQERGWGKRWTGVAGMSPPDLDSSLEEQRGEDAGDGAAPSRVPEEDPLHFLRDEKDGSADQGAIVRGGEVFKDATHDCHDHADLSDSGDSAEHAAKAKEDEASDEAPNNDTHNEEDEYDREDEGDEEGPQIPARDESLGYAEAEPMTEDSSSTPIDRGKGRV